jgi:hypothetical protein
MPGNGMSKGNASEVDDEWSIGGGRDIFKSALDCVSNVKATLGRCRFAARTRQELH